MTPFRTPWLTHGLCAYCCPHFRFRCRDAKRRIPLLCAWGSPTVRAAEQGGGRPVEKRRWRRTNVEIRILARINRALRAAAAWAEDQNRGTESLRHRAALCALIVICAALLGSRLLLLAGLFMGDERSWSSGLLSRFLSGCSNTDLTRARAQRMPLSLSGQRQSADEKRAGGGRLRQE